MTDCHVYYVRHGENRANLTGELSHRVVDHPLTALGRRQASMVAEALAAVPVSGPVVTSPLHRATQTAAVTADRLGVPVVVDERLREVDVGVLDGRSDAQARQTYDTIQHAWRAGEYDRRYPGGESGRELVERLHAALLDVVSSHPGGSLVVVGHGAIARVGLRGIGVAGAEAIVDDMANCSVTELRLRLAESGPLRLCGEVVEWGRAAHLLR